MRTDKNFDKNLAMVGAMIEAGDAVDPVDLFIAKEVMMMARERLFKLPVIKSCETCFHYKDGLCALAEAEPPEEIKQTGCEVWLISTVDPWDVPGHFEIGA